MCAKFFQHNGTEEEVLKWVGQRRISYSMEQSPFWETNRFSASQEIPRILWNPKFITVFTSARHMSLSWANLIQSTPLHPTSWKFILILSSYLHLGLPSDLFPSGFPTKTLCTPLLSRICATCPAHLILLNFITRTKVGSTDRISY